MHFSVNIPTSSDTIGLFFLAFILGFVLGSIPSGFLVGRLKGIDIRQHGSGNIGFTNVARVMGWPYALPVLLFDVAKGFLPAFFIVSLTYNVLASPGDLMTLPRLLGYRLELLKVIAGLGAITGHVFSPVMRFKGGKGVATTAGVVAALAPTAFAVGVGVFVIVLVLSRHLSLASIIAAVALPISTAILLPHRWLIVIFTTAIAALLVIRHLSNIWRLLAGTEPRFTLKRRAKPPDVPGTEP